MFVRKSSNTGIKRITTSFQGWSTQRGIALAQGLMASALLGTVSLVGVDWAVKQAAIDRERSQAQSMLLINSAAGSYLTRFHDQLVAVKADGTDALPASCSTISMAWGNSNDVPAIIKNGGCRINAILTRHADGSADKTQEVNNAMQPTLVELKAMGLLDAGVSETPLLPVVMGVAQPNVSGTASTEPAVNSYSVVIFPRCIGAGITSSCKLENKAFTSVVFNNQPFESSSSSSQNFAQLLGGLGPDGAISGPADTGITDPVLRVNPKGEFRSLGRGWTLDNPIKRQWQYNTQDGHTENYWRGVDGIAMVRNGYDASTALEYTRRDGSSPPSADWDFNGKNLGNVGKLQVTGDISGKNGTLQVVGNQSVSGNLDIKGNQSVAGNQDVKGNLTVGKAGVEGGAGTGILTALSDMIVNGATELKGKLTVAGAALFKGEVTFEQLVKGKDIELSGKLSASNIDVAGGISGSHLHIGHTAITADGTLLGSASGWGVDDGASCSTGAEYALAQNKSGQLMICSSGRWKQLINRRDTVVSASAAGQSCSPNGAAGSLPDGTLAVCTNGTWQAAVQGGVASGGSCSVTGALATNIPSGHSDYLDNAKYVMLVCDGSKWIEAPLTRPRPQYATVGLSCGIDREVALDGEVSTANPSLLTCVNGTWRNLTSRVVTVAANNWTGDPCPTNGSIALDSVGTGVVICKNNIWTVQTLPRGLGQACSEPDNTRIERSTTSANQIRYLWCVSGRWQDFPDHIYVTRWDGVGVFLNRGVKMGTKYYYLYSEDRYPNFNKPQTWYALYKWACKRAPSDCPALNNPNTMLNNDIFSYSENSRVTKLFAYIPELWELQDIYRQYGGRPSRWSFDLDGGAEFWTSTRNQGYEEHMTIDLWNDHEFTRWDSDARPVVVRVGFIDMSVGFLPLF